MSQSTSTESESSVKSATKRIDDSTEESAPPSERANGSVENAESGGDEPQEQERDDHRVEVTLALDNAAAAHVAALRDAGVPVGTILAQRLERPAEAVLYKAHQQRKYGQQDGQQSAGGR